MCGKSHKTRIFILAVTRGPSPNVEYEILGLLGACIQQNVTSATFLTVLYDRWKSSKNKPYTLIGYK